MLKQFVRDVFLNCQFSAAHRGALSKNVEPDDYVLNLRHRHVSNRNYWGEPADCLRRASLSAAMRQPNSRWRTTTYVTDSHNLEGFDAIT